MRRRAPLLALVGAAAAAAISIGIARGSATAHYDSARLSFDHPAGWTAEATEDISLELAVRLTPPTGTPAVVRSIVVLAGTRRTPEAELEGAADKVHAAHVRNRTAWGVRSDGGTPREAVRVAGRRAIRYRDRTGSALAASEQTLTCLTIEARLACVIAGAAPDAREESDRVAESILGTLVLKKAR